MVVIDLRYLQYYPNGLSMYSWNVLISMVKNSAEKEKIILLKARDDSFDDKIFELIKSKQNIEIVRKSKLNSNFYFTSFNEARIYLSFHYTLPLNIRSNSGIVIIHDTMPLEDINYLKGNLILKYLKRSLFKFHLHLTLKKAKTIFSPSEYSAKKISRFSKHKRNIKILPPGIEQKIIESNQKEIELKNKLNFLYIGENRKHKQVDKFIEIFEHIKKSNNNSTFIVCGRNWERKKKGNVIFKGEITLEEKIHLIKDTTFIVLISKYEGYGIPLDEAHILGTPAIISDLEVFHNRITKLDIVLKEFSDPKKNAEKILHHHKLLNGEKTLSNIQINDRNWGEIASKIKKECQK